MHDIYEPLVLEQQWWLTKLKEIINLCILNVYAYLHNQCFLEFYLKIYLYADIAQLGLTEYSPINQITNILKGL